MPFRLRRLVVVGEIGTGTGTGTGVSGTVLFSRSRSSRSILMRWK
jgi:hypothetical protein